MKISTKYLSLFALTLSAASLVACNGGNGSGSGSSLGGSNTSAGVNTTRNDQISIDPVGQIPLTGVRHEFLVRISNPLDDSYQVKKLR